MARGGGGGGGGRGGRGGGTGRGGTRSRSWRSNSGGQRHWPGLSEGHGQGRRRRGRALPAPLGRSGQSRCRPQRPHRGGRAAAGCDGCRGEVDAGAAAAAHGAAAPAAGSHGCAGSPSLRGRRLRLQFRPRASGVPARMGACPATSPRRGGGAPRQDRAPARWSAAAPAGKRWGAEELRGLGRGPRGRSAGGGWGAGSEAARAGWRGCRWPGCGGSGACSPRVG
mmetsp:Transcript_6789/g.27806  ORF Transcript_6789/g.27806 Transcript_6789/m.27806 type:complete len:224 (-) Transcript_6789:181-852(-)